MEIILSQIIVRKLENAEAWGTVSNLHWDEQSIVW